MLKPLQTSALVPDVARSDKNGQDFLQVDQRVLPATHSLYVKGGSILKLSAALIESYEGLCKDVAALDRSLLVGHTWEEDARRIEHLLEAGRRTAEERITGQADKRIVPAGLSSTKEARGGGARKRERDGWAKVAKQTSKGIKKLVRALPREE